MKLYIIYTDQDVLISKKDYSSWKEIQEEYVDFKTSLGPWQTEDVIDFLSCEYEEKLLPSASVQVNSLLRESDLATALSWKQLSYKLEKDHMNLQFEQTIRDIQSLASERRKIAMSRFQ